MHTRTLGERERETERAMHRSVYAVYAYALSLYSLSVRQTLLKIEMQTPQYRTQSVR